MKIQMKLFELGKVTESKILATLGDRPAFLTREEHILTHVLLIINTRII